MKQVTQAQTKTETFALGTDKLPQKASINIDIDNEGAGWQGEVGEGGGLGYKGRSLANDTTF